MTTKKHIKLEVKEITDPDTGEHGYTVAVDGDTSVFKIFKTQKEAMAVKEKWDVINTTYNQQK